jgi:hypothetical protein
MNARAAFFAALSSLLGVFAYGPRMAAGQAPAQFEVASVKTNTSADGMNPSVLHAQTGGATPPQTAAKPVTGLVGKWQSPDSLVEFNADGTLLIGDVLYRYTVQGNTLTLIGADGSVPLPFQLAGDRLTVAINGQLTVLQRFVAGQTEPGGTTPAEMAGKWCYFANFNANNGGGTVTDECFTINANGTYTYHRESSMSAYAPGVYGSTASTQNDAGGWTLDGTRLIVNSRTSGTSTYTLEKKNNPKNRDPMLCLDGRCFVTYGPKPPWR